MGQLKLDTLRNAIRTQIYGRRLGLDTTADQGTAVGGSLLRGGLLVGHFAQRLPIQQITTTGGSSVIPAGYVELSCTTASSAINTIQAPIPGAEVTIYVGSTNQSTLGHVLQAGAGVTFSGTTGSSANQITFLQTGASIRLLGISTSLFTILGYTPASSAGMSTAQMFLSTF